MKSNPSAASEDKLGKLHDTVTDLFQRKLDLMNKEADATPEDAAFIIDTRDLNAAGKWVAYNEITSPLPEKDGKSELSTTLADIKKKHGNKIIDFKDKKEANG